MHRLLIAGIPWFTTLGAVAQDFQFMPFAPRALESLLPSPPPRVWRGYATSADLDGDGRIDLVVTHEAGASVHLRTATGWAPPTGSIALPRQKPLLVDLDSDGDQDLAFVPPHPSSQQRVLIYENVQGTMTPVALPAVMDSAYVSGAAVGDLDGDAFADLVVATPGWPGVPPLVLVRGGPGLQYTIDVTSMPSGLPNGLWPELIDADGDGDLDVLASSAISGLRFVRNDGGAFVDATATLPAPPPARIGPSWLVSADLDGDGHSDCAGTLGNGVIDVLWGAPGGLTLAIAVTSVPHLGLRGLSPADFDGDGDLDLLAEHEDGLDVLWNQGHRHFGRGAILGEPSSLRGACDVDGDGLADVVFAAAAAETLLRCRYQARYETAACAHGIGPFRVDGRCLSVAGDIDGDGRTDLVTPEWNRINVDHALGGNVYRRSVSPLSIVAAFGLWHAELADMDGDTDLDLVVKDNMVSVAANDGTGTFTLILQTNSAGAGRDGLRLGDVDFDGDLDIVEAEDAGIVLIRNLGGGQFASPVVVVPAGPAPRCVELADVDSDGDLDVIADIVVGGGHRIAANDGRGNFGAHAGHFVNLGVLPISVRAGDIDADGDPDLLVAGPSPRVLRNNGSGFFTDTSATDMPSVPGTVNSNLVVADLDDDGDLDAAALLAGTSTNCMLLFNDGSGRFVDLSAQRTRLPVMNPSGQLRGADIDDDGDCDLIAADTGIQLLILNHRRHVRTNAVPRLGGVADLHLMSGPNFGQPGLGLLGVGFALAATPLQLPGLAGRLDLDPATLQVAAVVTTSSIGVSSAFVAVPQDAALFGLEVWFQGAILPGIGQPGFTNAIYERVLR